MKIEMMDRKTIEYDEEAGVALFDKVGIEFTIFDVTVDAKGVPLIQGATGEWFVYHGAKDSVLREAKDRYRARVRAAKEFM